MRRARVLIGGVIVVVALPLLSLLLLFLAQPTSYRVSRTRTIAAPQARVMAQLSDLRAFAAWEPWRTLPGAVVTVTYSTQSAGVGAWIDRRGDDGGSRTTITALTTERVEMANVTSGAFGHEGQSTQTFELRPLASGTEVTWTLSGEIGPLGRLLWPFVGLEREVGTEMDAGLGRLDHASH